MKIRTLMLLAALGQEQSVARAFADDRAAFSALITSTPVPSMAVEARWANPKNQAAVHILFDPASLAFVFVQPDFVRIRDMNGRCSTAHAPFETLEEHSGPAETDGFDADLDRFTTFFAVRHFARDPIGVTAVKRHPSGVFVVRTEYFQSSRRHSFTVDWAKYGNTRMRRDWVIGQDSSVLEVREDDAAVGRPVEYSPKAPAGSWLIETPDLPLRQARLTPASPSQFTLAYAREMVKELSRTSERKLVYTRNPGTDTPGDIATPATHPATGDPEESSLSWRWPLLVAGLVVLGVSLYARRRQG